MTDGKTNPNLPAMPGTAAAPPAANLMLPVFGDVASFEAAQRIATALAKSTLVPSDYQNNVPNCLIAMEMSSRVGMSVLMVMQNLHMIEGKPSWAASFLVASVNASRRFTPINYEREDRGKKKVVYAEAVWNPNKQGKGGKMGAYDYVSKEMIVEDYAFRAVASDTRTGEKLVGPWVSLEMAIQEGWYHRRGSKYKTMPELMLRYRSASFFSRLYCPEISLGMHTTDEAYDYNEAVTVDTPYEVVETTQPAAPVNLENIKATGGKKGGKPNTPAPPPAPDNDPVLPEPENEPQEPAEEDTRDEDVV